MSRRIVVCALALAIAGAVVVPSTSHAQAAPGSLTEGSWLSGLWNQVLDTIGIQIDGNGIASQIGIQIDGNGTRSDIGIQIDGNGSAAPTDEPGT
ncbi:MAG TPA: hypothetical protein VGS22_07645 [Thermoanaerobaculia bacterium]|jgi:hypothetical protein|nr:hypothetical protein [Thermoanaerobaculia bacterium]